LELERVPLAVDVMLKAFNWTILTSLTLLHSQGHEQLWKALRRNFTPKPLNGVSKSPVDASSYHLRIKKIHTNSVSPSLVAFLKDTLAPNSLEVLFLQDERSYNSTVSIDSIFRGAIKRHRASLKKLMIDSSEKILTDFPTVNARWKKWIVNREMITYLTSGRMSGLREVAFSIDYKDWVGSPSLTTRTRTNQSQALLPPTPAPDTSYPLPVFTQHRRSPSRLEY